MRRPEGRWERPFGPFSPTMEGVETIQNGDAAGVAVARGSLQYHHFFSSTFVVISCVVMTGIVALWFKYGPRALAVRAAPQPCHQDVLC